MKVSIITPSFQQGKFIGRTLKSVVIQTGEVFEHVIFDGGSTDNTVKILKQFKSSVKWFSKKDKGQSDAVNQGIRATKGEIIGWLNSDDIYYPKTVERVKNYFTENPEIDVVYGMADHIDIKDNTIESYPTEPWNLERLKETCFICQPALFFRRRLVEKHGYLDESLKYCMDYQYWLRFGMAGVRFGYLREKLAGSRLYAANKTIGARVKVHREINDMLKKLFGKVPDQWLYNYAHAVTENRINRKMYPRFFVVYLLFASISASFYWNGCVSRQSKKELKCWMKDAMIHP